MLLYLTFFVPNWQQYERSVDHLVPPVVLNIGNPIVNMPGGCESTPR